jgi:acyl-[acyl-carrier-protein]-phospholipid O-acyltransferase/long-chain-fatty-acid--[acyl-carrier-protein] ligase
LKIKPKESHPVDAPDDTLNPFLFPLKWYRWSKSIKGINYTVLGLSVFWLIGSMIQMNLYIYCEEVLKLSNTATGSIMAFVAIGIGAGCYAAGVLSKHRVNTRLVTFGGIGMTLSMLAIILLPPNKVVFTGLIILFAFFAGLFKIPLNSFLQDRVQGRALGPVIAYNNQMVFIAILISAGVFALVEEYLGTLSVFVTILVVTIAITTVLWLRIPGARREEKGREMSNER